MPTVFFQKAVLKISGKFLENHWQQSAYGKLITMLNMSSVSDVFLGISWKYSEQLFYKKSPWMFHISLKSKSRSVLLMKQHSQNILVEVNPPQNWPWIQNGTSVVAAVMIWKLWITEEACYWYFEKKFHYRKCILP